VRIFKKMVEQAGNDKLASQIPRIDELGLGGRTFLMWGQVDRWIPVDHVDLWRTHVLSLACSKIYSGAGHIPHEEIPGETAADAHKFLSSS
jgi:pimeloyl-ACP methyl ester carboxylesterase